MKQSSQELLDRLHATLDMMEFGIELMRQNIRRALPNASSSEIERELKRWLIEQPKVFIPGQPPT